MQLTQLEIKGFKSFGDKITINFNEGVTAIVGPNGCGKSNVVDAIRWVLGEQSTRALRSEKMDNIIFNGTKSRKAANLAEVSLTFDNTKNILPTDFSQVTLTRRLYRTGESEYRLNDVQCRLKDITDLFLDTGIGADSYAIIELKMIDEIINNKEGSRRNLFEEASGISKYKLRKKQTFSKLKDTEADLDRVEDLLFEIEKNLKTLENQAKKTERYYKLRDQYKALSISLASFRIASFSKSLADIEEKEQIQRVEKLGIATQIDTLEADLQQQKLDSLTKEKNLAAQQKTTNEFTAKIRAYESEKRIKNEQLKHQQDKETRLKDELERDNNQLKHVQYNIKRLAEEKLQEDENLHSITLQVAELKEAVDELRLSQNEARNQP
jgi:chromosome segregation protein